MIEKAVYALHRQLRPLYGETVFNVSFEHKDASGYWFAFETTNDSRRQTWCVRHTDL